VALVTGVVTPGEFRLWWDPDPLPADTRLLLYASRLFPPDPAGGKVAAGDFVEVCCSLLAGVPKCGQSLWLLADTGLGAGSPLDVLSAYGARWRRPYPGQDVVVFWRTVVGGAVVESLFTVLRVGA
jgi:hypothetical protein